MNALLGPFEKIIIGIVLVLLGIYLAIDHYLPSVIYPELNNITHDPAEAVSAAPRKGRVIPTNSFSAYLSDPSSFLVQDEFARQSGSSQYDPAMINWFAKGTDGLPHPSNAFLIGFTPFYTSKSWVPLLAMSLRVRYTRDDQFKVNDDTWQTSYETYTRMWGDCEDHSILLADWLMGLGYDARVVAGTVQGEPHAWVVLLQDGKEYLLESTDKASRRRFPLMQLHPEYVPAFMFNKDHFWAVVTENKGWKNRLATSRWVELSAFQETF